MRPCGILRPAGAAKQTAVAPSYNRSRPADARRVVPNKALRRSPMRRTVVAILALAALPLGAAAAQQPAATPAAPAPGGPVVVLETSMGNIKVALKQDKAPLSVANFLEYVKAGHYNGTVFHRVIPGFMVQGGGMDA